MHSRGRVWFGFALPLRVGRNRACSTSMALVSHDPKIRDVVDDAPLDVVGIGIRASARAVACPLPTLSMTLSSTLILTLTNYKALSSSHAAQSLSTYESHQLG